MTDQKISQLTDGSTPQSADAFAIARSGENFSLTWSEMLAAIPAGGGDTLHTVSSSGSSLTVDYSTADVWDITLTAACTLSLSGFTTGDPDFLTLILRQDGAGSRLVTWPTITWIGSGIAPILQTAAGAVDTVVLFSVDGGTTVYGIAQTSASGLRSGTSFPGSPSDGDLFYRTDRRIIYEYDSTSTNWLSLDRKYWAGALGSFLENTTTTGTCGNWPLHEDVYIEEWVAVGFTAATNNGSNFNTYTLNKTDASGTNISLGSFNTSADTASTRVDHSQSIAAVVSASSFRFLTAVIAKTGTPGTHFYMHTLIVRSVG